MSFTFTKRSAEVERTVTQKASIFLRLVADEIVNTAQPKTPASSKNPRLRNDVLKQVLGLHAIIKWDKVYAQYQESGQRADGSHKVKNYTTPGTGAHFAANAVQSVLKRTQAIAKKAGLL